MALFEFNLVPLVDLLPWGEEPNLSLTWYGLTDGHYYMNVGDAQLFRYSDPILQLWSDEREEYQHSYFEYQVARLYEDILYALPDIIQPIPDRVFQHIETVDKQIHWFAGLSSIYQTLEDDESNELYYESTEWIDVRSPDGLGGGPHFWILRHKDTVYIRWFNRDTTFGETEVWAASVGEHRMTVDEFISEIRHFHVTLMQRMQKRVNTIVEDNPFPHVTIDIPGLVAEHEERSKSVDSAISRNPTIADWSSVIDAGSKLLAKNN